MHGAVAKWVKASAATGKKWVVACDEPGDATHSLVTDAEDPAHDMARKNALWGTLMAGGAGVEWYFGYKHPESDLTCQDWRSRENMWDQCRYAMEFFKDGDIPFWEMVNDNALSSNDDSYCFAKVGEVYVVYLKNGGETELDLREAKGKFELSWFNPRNGQFTGKSQSVKGGGQVSIESPPADSGQDWVALVRR